MESAAGTERRFNLLSAASFIGITIDLFAACFFRVHKADDGVIA
jgi:hypothetical protein